MGVIIKGIAAASAIFTLIIGFISMGDTSLWMTLITWISGACTSFLIYVFGCMFDMVEENNTYLRELMYRTTPASDGRPAMGHSRASLDKLKDFKMNGQEHS